MAELLTLPVVCLPQPEVLFPRQQLRLIMSEIEAKEQLPRDQPMPSLVACMPMANRPQKAHGYFHVGCAAKVLSVDRKTRSGRVAILMEGAFRVSLQSVESDVAGEHVIKARRVGDGRGPSSGMPFVHEILTTYRREGRAGGGGAKPYRGMSRLLANALASAALSRPNYPAS